MSNRVATREATIVSQVTILDAAGTEHSITVEWVPSQSAFAFAFRDAQGTLVAGSYASPETLIAAGEAITRMGQSAQMLRSLIEG